jgi:hypothetical protein
MAEETETQEDTTSSDEEEKKEEEESSSDNPITEAKKVRDEIAAKIKEFKELKNYVEEEKVKSILSGKSDGGSAQPMSKEETPEEYAKRISNNELKDGEG